MTFSVVAEAISERPPKYVRTPPLHRAFTSDFTRNSRSSRDGWANYAPIASPWRR